MSKRVLFCRSNPIAPDPRVEKEARCLQTAGYRVDIIGWDRSGELPINAGFGAGEIHRLSIRADYARGIMNIFPLLRWEYGLFSWLVRHRKNYDVIHACDFDTILPALMCKWLFRNFVVYDIFDFYADHLRATPGWIKKLIRKVDLWAIGKADATILVDDARRAQISSAAPRRLTVIYNSPEDVVPHGAVGGNDPEGFSLAYIGLLQTERGLLDILKVLCDRPEWRLDLAGFGGDEALILESIGEMTNVTWHARVSYEIAIKLSAGADALFALYDPAIPNHRYSSPNKLFEAMMLGKPIVVARDTSMDRIAAEEGFGLLVEYGDVHAIKIALDQLAKNPNLRADMGGRARLAYERIYGWHIMKKRLTNLYGDLLSESRR